MNNIAQDLSTIGSIATFLVNVFPDLSAGISGNLVIITDTARQHVENFTGQDVGSNSIADEFQPAIVDFAKADVVDLANAGTKGDKIELVDLSVDSKGEAMTAEQYRLLAEMKLKGLGRGVALVKSLS